MPRATFAGVSITRVSGESLNSLDVVRLSKLIEAASVSLDGDRETAKSYMLRAAELLRDLRQARGAALTAFSCARRGLATWQRKRVVAYVEANIGTNIRASDLARIVRLSKGHFFRAFRESFGEPPMAYVVKQRVVLGQELMRKSRAPLSQIALACGMCDQPHFTRLFHRIVGVSPGLWRRQFAGVRGVSTTARAGGVVAGYDFVN
jgi:AraC family transcriptional regulator